MNRFKEDVIDLFSGVRGGHVEQLLFSDTKRKEYSGSQLWYEFLRSARNYYVLSGETDVIRSFAGTIKQRTKNIDTIVDFGVGEDAATRRKVVPVIHGLENVKLYVGVDLSNDFLHSTEQIIQQECPGVRTVNIQADFYNTTFPIPGQKRLGLMFGSTITNQDMREKDEFPHNNIVSRLRHLKTLIGNDNEMLITYDANPDAGNAMNAYRNKYWSKHVTGLMYDVAKIAKGNFSAEAWQHKMVWDGNAHVIHQCAEATSDMSFSIDETELSVRKGQRFVMVNNFKYPKTLFQAMCEEAGFKLKDSISDVQNKVTLQHLTT